MTGTLTLDLTQPLGAFDMSAAERWHILLLRDGTPLARVDLASPGPVASEALFAAAVLRWADWETAREELVAKLRKRLGPAPGPVASSAVSCSVIVCTHRRPADIARLLSALCELSPAPAEIVVVDNDPGEHDCRVQALEAGARYVREDRRGLDNARNTGVAAARGEIVAFIDDDCVPSAGWLRRLPLEFSNPAVGAVTGPAFPHVLDTRARRRMEEQASLTRGLRRVEFDWTIFPVGGAGGVGVGANMAFRREALAALGPCPFPAELDAGTITESGGDTYAIARLLACGYRIVYDPATFVYHRHREDSRALHRAVLGYGMGLAAALTKLLLEDRELATPLSWMWLIGQYRRKQQQRLAGRADSVETRLAWDYLRGGLIGPSRWLRGRRAPQPASDPTADAGTHLAGVTHEPIPAIAGSSAGPSSTGATGSPAVSVIVPTHERPLALERCLEALAAQDLGAGSFEVIVVDDSAAASVAIDARHTARLTLRVIHSGGRGAADARNLGAASAAADLLLFLDDDIVAQPDLVRRHLERHEREPGEEVVVVGAYPPGSASDSLAAAGAALWWDDLFHAMERAIAPTYVFALSGNMSVSGAAFARSGGFDRRFGRYRREDWEWGLRVLGLGFTLRYEARARGVHEYSLQAAQRLQAARLEGHGDVLLVREHPDAGSAVLPLVSDPPHAGGWKRRLQRRAWASRHFRGATLRTLSGLEWARLRLLWVRLFNVAQRLSYEQGVREAGQRPERFEEQMLDLDLDGEQPIPVPTVAAPTLRVRVGGHEVARVRPALGLWTPELAEQIVAETPWPAVEQAALAGGYFPAWEEAHDQVRHAHVVFGPLHAPADFADRRQLVESGAVVSVAGGSGSSPGAEGPPAATAAEHWSQVLSGARAGGHPLVALTMPGVRPDARWLEEALVAFEGSSVGVVIGRGLPDAAPSVPLVLWRSPVAGERDAPLRAAVALQYVVLRSELLPWLDPEQAACGLLGPLLALVQDALEEGWVIGYRDVHGLSGEGQRRLDAARAFTTLRMHRSAARAATAGGELRRATLLAAWHFAKRREGRRVAAEDYAGALLGLLSSRSR